MLWFPAFYNSKLLFIIGKRDLVDYISAKQCRYNFKQLKTKIMNEQNKQQSISKKRMKKMLDEN